jgi:predicted DNA-binding transcriptional regulator AlpA
MIAKHQHAVESDSEAEPPEAYAMLLTKADLARELRCSIKSIDRADNSGRLPRAVRIGRAKRWSRQAILQWIAAGCPDREGFERFNKRSR